MQTDRNVLWVAVAIVALVACGGARREDPDKLFAARVPRECAAESTCSALEAELIARVNACIQGFNECAAARANLVAAREILSRLREQQEAPPEASPRTASLSIDGSPPVVPPLPSLKEQEAAEQEAKWKAGRRNHDLELARNAGPARRESDLRTCLKNRGFAQCSDQIAIALEASATRAEREKLSRIAAEAEGLQ